MRKYLCIGGLLCAIGCSDNRSISLPQPVTSPLGGYPIALEIQKTVAPGCFLGSVLVVWDREGLDFSVRKITYHFRPLLADRHGASVSLDNKKHLAYAETNAPAGGFIGTTGTDAVNLSGKPLLEMLEIAKANGLGDYCS